MILLAALLTASAGHVVQHQGCPVRELRDQWRLVCCSGSHVKKRVVGLCAEPLIGVVLGHVCVELAVVSPILRNRGPF